MGKNHFILFPTKENQQLSNTALGISCIMAAGISTSFLGFPLAGAIFNGIGAFAIIKDVLFKNNKHQKFFENTGLYVGSGENKEYPILKERKSTKYGESLMFSVPDGLCSQDFEKKIINIKEYFMAKSVEIKFNNGFIFVQLHNDQLEEFYEYDPVETNRILKIPIGHSARGIEFLDISEAPHVLIAGTSGSGKSTVVRSIITYLIQVKSKYGVDLHLMDFKRGVEFAHFRKSKAVKSFSRTVEEAEEVLYQISAEVDRRYDLFFQTGCKDIDQYNKKYKNEKLNHQVVIVDEFADFYLKNEKNSIILLEELLAKTRACGVHFIISTQRPDSKVINGRIKANTPTVIGLKTKDNTNSRIIIDESGLENLRGKGHALFQNNNGIEEIQCFFLDIEPSIECIRHTYVDKESNFKSKNSKKNKINEGVIDEIDITKIKLVAGGKKWLQIETIW